ncbi:MAG TPA: glycerophosphodiester phosphodiesterase family protein, partial [Chryseosolibacter sp.]
MKSYYRTPILFLIAILLVNCAPENAKKTSIDHFPDFYKEGHRGTRGLMPENTIPSMKKAIEDGANF